jgi:hypothetical protein
VRTPSEQNLPKRFAVFYGLLLTDLGKIEIKIVEKGEIIPVLGHNFGEYPHRSRSLPPWERGLKYPFDWQKSVAQGVAPPVGAWIEIILSMEEKMGDQIKSLQLEINHLEGDIEQTQARYTKVNGRYIAAEIVFGIGLIGFLFLAGFWPLWIFLLVISILTWLSNFGKRKTLQREIDDKKTLLRSKKDQLIQAA